MEHIVPRVLIAGTNSGCGKTTVCCAVLKALVNRGMSVSAFKCGPDYIDPMFHSKIIGADSSNLDSFFFSENTLKYLLAKNAESRDVSIIEGVMGFYDGMALSNAKASTYEVSEITQSPTVLVVGAKGASLSVLATIQGFLTFYPQNQICGVILNECSAGTYKMLYPEIIKRFGGRITPLGFMPCLPDCTFSGRHLGLVTADEVKDLKEKLDKLSKQAEETIDIDGLLELAKSAKSVLCTPISFKKFGEPIRIAYAYDKAFCFYYKENLRILEEMGAELVPFSPLDDRELPQNIHGIYLGGGYPELYARKLSENVSMLNSVRQALENEIPCIAECGGYMYLTESIDGFKMVGFLRGNCFDTGRLTRFGYVKLTAKEDNMLCKKGEETTAHEFHYWDASEPGDSFTASKASGKSWECIVSSKKLYAGFPHFHFYANKGFAENFYETCLKEKHRYD